MSLPEIDGAIEPIIYAVHEGATGRSGVNLLVDWLLKWSNLRIKKNADNKIAITIFSFSPDKGNVGTVAYLDVFDSIKAVLKQFKKEGFDIGDAPDSKEAIMESVLNDPEAWINSPELNVAYRMSTDEYYDLTPYVKDLEKNWGPAPGNLNSDGQNLVIYGKQFGNVFIGVQLSFGYEGDRCACSLPSPPVLTTALQFTTPTWRRSSRPTQSCTSVPTDRSSSCPVSRWG